MVDEICWKSLKKLFNILKDEMTALEQIVKIPSEKITNTTELDSAKAIVDEMIITLGTIKSPTLRDARNRLVEAAILRSGRKDIIIDKI